MACKVNSIFDEVFKILATSKTWTQTLDLDPGHGLRKTWILKNMDPKKLGP